MPFLATASSESRPEARAGQSMTFGIDAGANGLEHVAAREIDCRSQTVIEANDLGLAGGDHGLNDERHATASKIMGFEGLAGDAGFLAETGLHRHDFAADDDRGIYFAERHSEQVEDADSGAGRYRLNPQSEVAGEDRKQDQSKNQQDQDHDDRGDLAKVLGE